MRSWVVVDGPTHPDREAVCLVPPSCWCRTSPRLTHHLLDLVCSSFSGAPGDPSLPGGGPRQKHSAGAVLVRGLHHEAAAQQALHAAGGELRYGLLSQEKGGVGEEVVEREEGEACLTCCLHPPLETFYFIKIGDTDESINTKSRKAAFHSSFLQNCDLQAFPLHVVKQISCNSLKIWSHETPLWLGRRYKMFCDKSAFQCQEWTGPWSACWIHFTSCCCCFWINKQTNH